MLCVGGCGVLRLGWVWVGLGWYEGCGREGFYGVEWGSMRLLLACPQVRCAFHGHKWEERMMRLRFQRGVIGGNDAARTKLLDCCLILGRDMGGGNRSKKCKERLIPLYMTPESS